MTSLFITGASGFLGSYMLNKLNPGDFQTLTLLSRSKINLPSNLTSANNVKIIKASISDTATYSSSLTADTIIVHLAAVTGKASPAEYFSVNTCGTQQLIAAAKNAGVSKFLFISSIAVSFTDRKGYYYAESKEQAEKSLAASGLNYCILRPTIILGKTSPIWRSFLKLAGSSIIVLPGNGKIPIQPVFIDDMVYLILRVITTARFNNEIIEIGGPDILSMDDFVQCIHQKLTTKRARIIHLPLGLLVATLRLIETIFPTLLPVNSGQFSSFCNDGTAKENSLVTDNVGELKNMDAMLNLLIEDGP